MGNALVVILDSGLRGPGGHNLSYTCAVQGALRERGLAVEVLVNRGCPPELADAHAFRRLFTSGAYDHPLGHGRLRDLVYLHAQSLVFAEELDHAIRCVLGRPPDLLFSHTLADFEVVGWRRYLRRRSWPGWLALLMRQTPRYSTCGWLQRQLNPYWRLRPRSFAAMRHRLGPRFQLCTDSALLSRDYARVYDGSILTLPIPLTSDVRSGEQPGPPNIFRRYPPKDVPGPTIGYLGDARTPKGFPLLPRAVSRIQDAGLAARFLIQCPLPAGGADAETAKALDELRALSADSRSSVTLIPEHLGDADYAGLLDALDVVLLPYVHSNYLEATSGVFTEALAKGIPVVVPTATWMAHELAGSTAGTVFSREEPEAFPAALLRLLASLDQHKAAARGRRDAWQATHNPGALVGQLLTATCAPRQ